VFRLVLVVIVLPWLMRVVLPDRQHLRSALTAFVAGCGLSGSGTLLQFAFGETIIPNTGVTNAGRFAGLTQNVSDTGGICCAGVVGAIALLATATGRRSRAIPLLALVGSVFGLVLSGSVSGLLSTAIGFVVLALSGVLRPRVVLGSIVAFAAVLALSVVIQTESGALNPVQRILQTTGQSADNRYNTAGSRLSTYTEALRKFIENPIIGSGLDPNSTIADGIYPAHNLFLAAAFEGGVLLAIGVLLAVLRAFRGGVLRRMRADPALATAVALVVTELVFAMTAPSLYNRYLWIPIALLLTTRIIAMPRPQPRPADVPDVRAAPVDKTIEFVLAGDPIGMRRRKRHS
jgi:O-antigen ligase